MNTTSLSPTTAELLRKRAGVSLARRTITKYRKVLAIPSSSKRRVF